MTFYVFVCDKCHSPNSVRAVESVANPKVFKCFVCDKTTSLKDKKAFVIKESYIDASIEVRKKKLELWRERV